MKTEELINQKLKQNLIDALTLKPRISVWDYMCEHVIFSPEYSKNKYGKYDPNFLPFWKEPLECLTDTNIKETWICACVQSGKTEQLILGYLRYLCAYRPDDALVVFAGQESAEAFFVERVLKALNDNEDTRHVIKQSQVRGTEIHTPFCKLITTWASSFTGLKSRAVPNIILDEVSAYEVDTVDRARQRMNTFAYSHLVGVSSPDDMRGRRKQEEDPIFINFKLGDQRYYHLPDPKTGNWFKLEMGFRQADGMESTYGLKWDKNAKVGDEWDMDRVRKTAHYVTPDGTIIDDKTKYELMPQGKWIPTAEPESPSIRSYHLNCLYLPYKKFTFGEIAVKFLSAKKNKAALKIFVNENLAEMWKENAEENVKDYEVKRREMEYPKGTIFTEMEPWKTKYKDVQKCNIMTIDVQKTTVYWLVRHWTKTGDSGLVEWGQAYTWEEVWRQVEKYKPALVLVDSPYRKLEVYEEAYNRGYICTKGETKIDSDIPFVAKFINPFEGTRRQNEGASIPYWLIDVNIFKDELNEKIKGNGWGRWGIYKNIDVAYCAMMTSEIKRNGTWDVKKEHMANHLWDCYDAETEVLTNEGWMKFESLTFDNTVATVNMSNNNQIEYQRPINIINKTYDGTMVQFGGGPNQRIDLLVTPTHRMVTAKANDSTSKWTITEAKDCLPSYCLPTCGSAISDGDNSPIVFEKCSNKSKHGTYVVNRIDVARFMGWFLAEGYCSGNNIIIYQNYGEKRDRIKRVVSLLPWGWSETKRGIVIRSKQLSDFVRNLGNKYTKRMPQWLKDSSKEVLDAYFAEAILGDGWKEGKTDSYCSVSKQLADDFQECMTKCGYPTSLYTKHRKDYCINGRSGTNTVNQYWVHRKLNKRAMFKNSKSISNIKIIHYSGKVYCCTVPNGTLIVRRNGKVAVCGNCENLQMVAAYYLGMWGSETNNAGGVNDRQVIPNDGVQGAKQ